MSENMHTKEPWDCLETLVFLGNEGGFDLRSAPNAKANARRIVACVNACAGLDSDYLEKYGLPDFAQKISDLAQQRDTLLAACETFMSHGVCEVSYYAIRDAIAAAKPKDNESNKEAA